MASPTSGSRGTSAQTMRGTARIRIWMAYLSMRSPLVTKQGRKQPLGTPGGLSGGGVWLVPDASAPRNAYLDGIAIVYHQRGALVRFTRVEEAFLFNLEPVLTA